MLGKLDFDFKIGFALTGFIVLLVLVGQFYTPYDPYIMNTLQRFSPPSFSHFFGTDNFGRDNFSRVMIGTRFTLLVAISTVTIGAFSGIVLGLVAGYIGGAIDEVIMRLIDAMTSFPGILLALVMVTVLDRGDYTIIVALGILFIPSYTRIVRSGALQFKNREFVLSALGIGASPFRIMFIHLLPNIYPQLLTGVIIGLSNAILAESSLSYLGLGIQPPTPSWGRMLFEAQSYLFNAPWYALAPGFMIMITVLGFNFIGEGLRKA
ncbi:MAG: ABC transporter permease [Chloroflexi bacterium]|uniref:ABC transporter permease n=1 Tax=Candidatus Chlorohelix allophototropha TaxID=3003348 RepID=A0A8T7M475_9CHLR|nr:ABC transporter permease [Chloroflexota bacterium]WJW70142.1 ABC transporter permease [Chloroflexota bacterium L227-S17]